MHRITIVAMCSTLTFAVAANAQEPPEDPAPIREPVVDPEAPSSSVKNQIVIVVDISTLPKAKQTQVNQVVAQRGEVELHKLRTAIDAAPNIKSALEAKGLSSRHVLIAEISANGRLTLVTRKKL